jgi:hypothetical protein
MSVSFPLRLDVLEDGSSFSNGVVSSSSSTVRRRCGVFRHNDASADSSVEFLLLMVFVVNVLAENTSYLVTVTHKY